VGRPVALCSEPLFIDNKEHQKLLSEGGIGRLAEAMVNGILKWKGLA
jgi:N-acetylmuramoyl-L-alanine amidase